MRNNTLKLSTMLTASIAVLVVTASLGFFVYAAGEPNDGSDGSVIDFDITNTPVGSTLQQLSDSDSREISRSVVINVNKTDVEDGAPLKGAVFDVYEDDVKVGTITTGDDGKGSYTHTETKTITSETYTESYATNYDELTPAKKAQTQTLAQATAKIEAAIAADLAAKESAFKSATHDYELEETTAPDGYQKPTTRFTYVPATPNP